VADEIDLVYLDLTGAERKTLHHALMSAFDRARLTELLDFRLDERLDAVTSGGSLSEVVLSLIGWAEQQARVFQLVRAAHEEVPGNDEVTAAFELVQTRAIAARDTPRPAPSRKPRPVPKSARRPAPALADDPAPQAEISSGWDFNPLAVKATAPLTPGVPSAALGVIMVTHNLPFVPHPQGLSPGPGMRLAVMGTLSHAMGRTMQIVIRFVFPNGAMLYAAAQEVAFRDATGYCAVATPPTPVAAETVQLDSFAVVMPYYVLNLTPTNGLMIYQLSAIGTVYVDNAPIAQSMPTPFQVRW
jgi:hypothetical protein